MDIDPTWCSSHVSLTQAYCYMKAAVGTQTLVVDRRQICTQTSPGRKGENVMQLIELLNADD
jgi:hypothetical protein